MASGKIHDKFNLVVGILLVSLLFLLRLPFELVASFTAGFLLSTYIFSPDTDLMPKKRTGPLQYILFPYSIFFKHRGMSHSFLFGTVTRVFYGFLVFFVLIFVFHRMGYLNTDAQSIGVVIYNFLLKFNVEELPYKMIIFSFAGLFIADCSHIFLDKISSLFKKVFN